MLWQIFVIRSLFNTVYIRKGGHVYIESDRGDQRLRKNITKCRFLAYCLYVSIWMSHSPLKFMGIKDI